MHKVFAYDTKRYDFRGFLKEIYGVDDLSQMHLASNDYKKWKEGEYASLENVETDIHKAFYTKIKSDDEYKKRYCSLVRDLTSELFEKETQIIYQSFPSIRFQFPGNVAIPPHCDSDEIGKHPLGERNFLLPITDMKGTTRLFVESAPGKGDFQGIDLVYGEILFFNGNTCIHYNQENKEDYMRISFDFRMLSPLQYRRYISSAAITTTNPRDLKGERKPVRMTVGGYYQSMDMAEREKDLEWHSVKQLIMQTRPSFNNGEGEASAAYFKEGDPFLTEFKKTEELESRLANLIDVKHCFMTTSGSTAILCALIALGIKPDDEVILPDYTMIATANAVRLLGAKPVFVDVRADTFTLGLEQVKSARTEKTRAVIHVSLNNRSYGLRELASYCKIEGLFLIEDAAQSIGCRLDGKHYGTFGDIGCFSFSTPKIITLGQGGCVVTQDESLAKKLFQIKNFGRESGGSEVYSTFGLNFKITDIQAIIGLCQLSDLERRVVFMRRLFDMYRSLLKSPEVSMLIPQNSEWIPWFVDILVEDRDALAVFLKAHNIQTRVTYPSIHATNVYKEVGEFPNTHVISSKGLFLPSHTLVSDADIEYICKIINLYYYV